MKLPAHLSALLITLIGLVCPNLTAKEPPHPAPDSHQIKTLVHSDLIIMMSEGNFARFDLTLRGPGDFYLRESFTGFEVPSIDIFDAEGSVFADGQYVYQLVGAPLISEDLRVAMQRARSTGDEAAIRLMRKQGLLPKGFVHTGTFRIVDGLIVSGEDAEPMGLGPIEAFYVDENGRQEGSEPPYPPVPEEGTYFDEGEFDYDEPRRDVVVPDDLIVDGSACIGFDCVDGESFGYDTIRLKEHNLRIKFEDTSTAGSYPRADWQLRANDSQNGALERFSIDEISGGRTPFTIEAGAANHSFWAAAGGQIGIKTAVPIMDLHIRAGDSPALRLEQDATSGFDPQTWDIAGNDANFFVRDATNGSSLPFRIFPKSKTSTLTINEAGVGVGHSSPRELLHVKNPDGPAIALVDGPEPTIQAERNNGGTNNSHILMDLINDGQVNLRYNNNAGGINRRWNTGVDAGNKYFISAAGTGTFEFVLDTNGDLNTAGTVNGVSDVNMKRDFAPVSPEEILAKVNQLPMTTWSYTRDERGTRHLGPMAQDFHAAFGLGRDERHIAFTDSAGVALTAIQGLSKLVKDLQAEVAAQKQRIAELEAKLTK